MVLDIVKLGAPVLREKCAPVTKFDGELWKLLDDMKETVRAADGAGLAAPQVGVPIRACVVDVEEGFFELINPIFVWKRGEQYGPEGCLSVPGQSGDVLRPNKVKVIFQDRHGEKYSLVARDFFARAVCHEVDHLDGILYIDTAEGLHPVQD